MLRCRESPGKILLAADLDVRFLLGRVAFLPGRVARDAEFFDLRPDIWH